MRNFKHSLTADMELARRQVIACEREVRKLPKGTLQVGNNRKSLYLKDEKGKITYVNRNHPVVAGICRRRFLEKKLQILKENLKRQEKLLETYTPYTDEAILQQLPAVYRGRMDEILKETLKMRKPLNKLRYGDRKGHKNIDGIEMDSKSEVIIAMLLDSYGVPYACDEVLFWPKTMPEEAELSKKEMDLPNMIVPDFVFTLPSGEKIYWEHLGMLSVKKYSVRWMTKLVFYHWLGITQGVNLIVTADDCHGTLDSEAIADIIESKLASLITKPKRH